MASDFPLNLWDMERMYEGVYGVLEFFAVVCEEGWGKEVLGQWEGVGELVTLVRELEGGIPRMGGVGAQYGGVGFAPDARRTVLPLRASSADARVPVRHSSTDFEARSPELDTRLPPLLATLPTQHQNQAFSPTSPLPSPYPTTNNVSYNAQAPPPPQQPEADEPSDFEWRNLKKLTVLVLSSLLWKNPLVQQQVRQHGGLEALIGCCRVDEHNPYIREHAIMCLRFAVEGCPENRAVLEGLSGARRERGRQASAYGMGFGEAEVPREVLDTNGYETFMDGKGQVGLRRKESQYQSTHPSSAYGAKEREQERAFQQVQSVVPSNGLPQPLLTAEKAAELMQSALRELPLGLGGSRDGVSREVMERLEGAFEGVEEVLGCVRR